MSGKRPSIVEVFGEIPEPRIEGRSKDNRLTQMQVLAACAMICSADDFVGIQAWGHERGDWLRRFQKPDNGIPSHDTQGRPCASRLGGEKRGGD